MRRSAGTRVVAVDREASARDARTLVPAMVPGAILGTLGYVAHPILSLLGFAVGTFGWLLVAARWSAKHGRPVIIACDDRGLLLQQALGGRRRIPWSTVVGVEFGDDSTTIRLSHGDLELGPRTDNGVQLGHAVMEHLGLPLADAEQGLPLSEDTIASLIAEVGGKAPEVSVDPVTPWGVVWTVLLGAAAMAIGVDGLAKGERGAIVSIALGLAYGPLLCWIARRQNPFRLVRAEPGGLVQLRWRGRAETPWTEVHSVYREGRWGYVRTRHGDIHVPTNAAGERVLAAVERVLAARKQGHLLPRLGFVGDAAISPVREGAERAERGISRSEGAADE